MIEDRLFAANNCAKTKLCNPMLIEQDQKVAMFR